MTQMMFETQCLLTDAAYDSALQKYCRKVVSYTLAETYYIFTVCNLVESNDTRTFYRQRVHHMSLRFFYFLVDF